MSPLVSLSQTKVASPDFQASGSKTLNKIHQNYEKLQMKLLCYKSFNQHSILQYSVNLESDRLQKEVKNPRREKFTMRIEYELAGNFCQVGTRLHTHTTQFGCEAPPVGK